MSGVAKRCLETRAEKHNAQKLIKRYGIQLQPTQTIQDGSQSTHNAQLAISDATIEKVEPVICEALKVKDNFKKLIADLRSHSESLYRLCPENAFESMNIYLTMECLARQESPDGLKWTSTLANQHATSDKESLVRQGYELLASTVILKASVNKNRDRKEASDRSLTSIDEIKREMKYLGKGLALFEEQVDYVEMRDYRGPPLDFTAEQKQRLKHRRKRERFFASLPRHSANMMKNVFGLDIVGMIDHTEGDDKGHCSILYRLPGTIGLQSRERPAENMKLRAPVTLQSLLGTRQKKGIRSMLGARFELARKLVRAVCLLHSSGWLHKNIRAESVMFFPEHPNLMGYIFSRPDDIIIQTKPPSAPETERLDVQIPPRTLAMDTTSWQSVHRDSELLRRKGTFRSASIYDRHMLGKAASTEEAKETNIGGFTLDYYQYPAKHADPKRLYRHAYDVYSFGILLTEVGLMEELED
ncbi:hypothetical protein FGADI_5387 [Fusarium gaditjirri]|uniref:Protein kinase domain-containing protein n=1 Tax=Fusarium gaditjirri TaxID=282569 RepID=A0A8H4TA87_9HYPO|nr:hypothetical protein FGADI_5387 [Fusarium gaditjirri]